MTLVSRLPQTAGMRLDSSRRQRQRNERSGKREQQQKSGGQSLHVSSVKQNPKVATSIKQNTKAVQTRERPHSTTVREDPPIGLPASCSGLAVDLGPPPPNSNEQESPVLKKLRRFAFEGVADELEDPAHDEQSKGIHPQVVNKD